MPSGTLAGTRFGLPRILATAIAIGLAGTPAPGFTGREHHAVSSHALRMALDYVGRGDVDPGGLTPPRIAAAGSDCEIALTEIDRRNLHLLLEDGSSHLSFAAFVKYVDFVLDPLKLLESPGNRHGLPVTYKDLNEDFLLRLRERPTLHFLASQNNDIHFQQSMMTAIWHWHRVAVSAAAQGDAPRAEPRPGRGNLFSALLFAAVASHFLEDFFAPGHVITPREGMQDYSAISMHDLYNKRGAAFRVENWPELAVLLDPKRHEEMLAIPENELDALKKGGPPGCTLKLRGDGYLLPSPRRLANDPALEQEARLQRALVTLVVARALVDVFESYACGEPTSHFSAFTWSGLAEARGVAQRQDLTLPVGGLWFGAYVDQDVDRVRYGWLTPIEVSFAASFEGRESSRGNVGFVVIPTRWAPPPGMNVDGIYIPKHAIPVLAFGAHYRVDDDLPGAGLFVRGTVISPRLDLNAGLGLGVERFTWDDQESYRFHPEVRVGVGASLVMVFAGVGYDYYLDERRELEGRVTLRAGLSFGIPWSRFGR